MIKVYATPISEQEFQQILDQYLIDAPDGSGKTLLITKAIREDLSRHTDKLDANPARITAVKTSNNGVPYAVATIEMPKRKPFEFYLFFDENFYMPRAVRLKTPDESFLPNPEAPSKPDVQARFTANALYAAYNKNTDFELNAPNGLPLYVDRSISIQLGVNKKPWSNERRHEFYQELKTHLRPTITDTTLNWMAFAHAMLFDDNPFSYACNKAYETCTKRTTFTGTPYEAFDQYGQPIYQNDFFANPKSPWPEYSTDR